MIKEVSGNWGPWYAEITPVGAGKFQVEFVRDDKGIRMPIHGRPYDRIAYIDDQATDPIYAYSMRSAKRIARVGLRSRRRRDKKLAAEAILVRNGGKVIVS